MTHRPASVVVTQGDPTGVGLELIVRAAAEGELHEGDRVLVDPDRLAERARGLAAPWAAAGLERVQALCEGAPGLTAVEALRLGVDEVLATPGRALVTAPIDKAACAAEGFAFPGHTEYLAHRAGDCDVAMLMAGSSLRVVLATIHIPLRCVAEELSSQDVVRAATLLAAALRERFEVRRPRLAVLGLNPHAGESGMLGDEERRIIDPAIARARVVDPEAEFVGPLPADTAFHAHRQGDYDGVVAMYHDQGLAPFKLVHFYDGVNVTLGLPFIRTSPDHGTAMDLVGTGKADPSSFFGAIRMARSQAG